MRTGHSRPWLAAAGVAYRLALDHPGRVERMATLDIVPTYDMWHGMDRNMAMKVWHWPFLAQPEPLPEMLITKAPVEYLEWKMASWTKAKKLSAFDRAPSRSYRAPSPIHRIAPSAALPRWQRHGCATPTLAQRRRRPQPGVYVGRRDIAVGTGRRSFASN